MKLYAASPRRIAANNALIFLEIADFSERVEKVEVAVAASSSEQSSEEEEPIDLLHRVELEREEPHGWGMDVEFDDETMENERDIDGLPEMMQHPSALQADNLNRMQHQKMSFQKSEITVSPRIAPVLVTEVVSFYNKIIKQKLR